MRKLLFGAFSIVLSSGILFTFEQPDGFLHFYALDVGQGDALFIQTPRGKKILIDGGPGDRVLAELGEVLPFFDSTLDYLILTHPDRDHIEGLIPVLKKYTVKRVIWTGVYKDEYLSKTFMRLLRDKKIPFTIAEAKADIILEDGVVIDILFPFHQMIGPQEKTNNLSLVAKVMYGENEILLTGDSEAPEEEILLKNRANVDADILKVAHHGSKTSTTDAFLKKVSPSVAVISMGANNSYHHPHPSVTARLQKAGVPIYRTDQRGRVEFVMDREKIVEINSKSQVPNNK